MNEFISDEEMIRRCLPHRPEQCFAALYNRYVSKVYRRCLSMTKDPLKAEDFTHDIFLKAFNKLEKFQERSTFSTWLYAISFNYCSDQLRQAKRYAHVPLEDELKQTVAESDEALHWEETIQTVSQIMTDLSARDQRMLHLKYTDNLSVHTIAQMCDLNVSTVKMRLKRSRDKIERLYNEREAVC